MIKKYYKSFIAAVGFIALFQNKVELGYSLGKIIELYNYLKNFLFLPFSLIDIEISDWAKNITTFLLLLTTTFLVRGKMINKIYILSFYGSLLWTLIGLIVMSLIGLIQLFFQDIFQGDPIILRYIFAFISLIIFIPCLFLLMNTVVWLILVLFPYLLTVLKKDKYSLFYVIVMTSSELSIRLYEYVLIKVLKRRDHVELTPDEKEKLFNKIIPNWTVEEIKEYYKPLIDLLFASGLIVIITKIIVDNII